MSTSDEARAALRLVRESPARLVEEQLRQRRSPRAVAVLAALLGLNATYVAAGDLPQTWELAVRGTVAVLVLGGTLGGLVSRRLAAALGESIRLRYRDLPPRHIVLPAVLGAAYGGTAPALGRWVDGTGVHRPSVVLAALLTSVLLVEVLAADRWLRRSQGTEA